MSETTANGSLTGSYVATVIDADMPNLYYMALRLENGEDKLVRLVDYLRDMEERLMAAIREQAAK